MRLAAAWNSALTAVANLIDAAGAGLGMQDLALGLAHVMISRGWYDREFVREWTNAPHLVRSDTGRLLRAADLANGGDAGHFVAWDGLADQPVAYDPATGRYGASVEHLALEGDAMVATKHGKSAARSIRDAESRDWRLAQVARQAHAWALEQFARRTPVLERRTRRHAR